MQPSRISRLDTILKHRRSVKDSVDEDTFVSDSTVPQQDPNSIPPPCTRFSFLEIGAMIMILILGIYAIFLYPDLVKEESERIETLWRLSSIYTLLKAANEKLDCESSYVLGLRYIFGINETIRDISKGEEYIQQAFDKCSCFNDKYNNNQVYDTSFSFLSLCRKR